MSTPVHRLISETHRNRSLLELKVRVLEQLRTVPAERAVEVLEEIVRDLRDRISEDDEGSEDEGDESDEGEDEDEGDEGEESDEDDRPEPPRPRGLQLPEPSKSSQVRLALEDGPLRLEALAMRFAGIPEDVSLDTVPRESRARLVSWKQIVLNVIRQGDAEKRSDGRVTLTEAGRAKNRMERAAKALRESPAEQMRLQTDDSEEAQTETPAEAAQAVVEQMVARAGVRGSESRLERRSVGRPKKEDAEKEDAESDAASEARMRAHEEAKEVATRKVERSVLDVFRRTKRAMPYREIVEQMAGEVPSVLAADGDDRGSVGAAVLKAIQSLHKGGFIAQDTLDSSKWRFVTDMPPEGRT